MLKNLLSASLVFGVVAAGAMSGALAQTEAEFVAAFSGDWEIHDDAFALNSRRCRVGLVNAAADGRYRLDNSSCAGELAGATRWGIVEGQMVIFAGSELVVTLGGNQHRMSGSTRSGIPVVLERVTSASAVSERLQSAYRQSGCYYLGMTEACAPKSALGKPVAEAGASAARIKVIVNLNARSEPREDAGVIGVVPADTCVVTEACATAADGVWCRARFGERTGWLRKLVLRQNRWPVVTFVNQC